MVDNLWVRPEELGDLADSEYAYEACKSASFLLWALSGRKFNGTATVTETYYGPDYRTISRQGLDLYAAAPGSVSTLALRTLSPGESRLRLRGQPIQSVISVEVGTEELDADQFIVENRSTLLLHRPTTADLTITYTYGQPPPELGHMAALTLAKEFTLAFNGREECSLPDRVTSISRQGISMTVLDNQDFIAELRTGVYLVDLFLKSVNPDAARARARVFSPDIRRARRRTDYDVGGYGTGGYGQ